jgi:hypothetical protein
MVSGGYGDIGMPMNLYEAAFLIWYEVFVYVAFMIVLNLIWDSIEEYRQDQLKYDRNLQVMNRYMKYKGK